MINKNAVVLDFALINNTGVDFVSTDRLCKTLPHIRGTRVLEVSAFTLYRIHSRRWPSSFASWFQVAV